MPMTAKDKKIMANMQKQYGDRAEEVFYASAQTGKLGSDVKKRHGAAARKKRYGK